MDKYHIFVPHVVLELPYGLYKRLAFNIPYSTSHFNYCYSCFIRAVIPEKSALYLISDMWYDLNGAAAVFSTALLI